MGIIRNSIDIVGITPEDKLPGKINGQLIEFSEIEHINIPEDKPRLGNIHQISIHVEPTTSRVIKAPNRKIIVLDGLKNIKIIYSYRSHSEKANIVKLQLPFNTFIELPENTIEVGDINIHIADAFFQTIEARTLYSYILYMVEVEITKSEPINNHHEVIPVSVPLNKQNTTVMYINGSEKYTDEADEDAEDTEQYFIHPSQYRMNKKL